MRKMLHIPQSGERKSLYLTALSLALDVHKKK